MTNKTGTIAVLSLLVISNAFAQERSVREQRSSKIGPTDSEKQFVANYEPLRRIERFADPTVWVSKPASWAGLKFREIQQYTERKLGPATGLPVQKYTAGQKITLGREILSGTEPSPVGLVNIRIIVAIDEIRDITPSLARDRKLNEAEMLEFKEVEGDDPIALYTTLSVLPSITYDPVGKRHHYEIERLGITTRGKLESTAKGHVDSLLETFAKHFHEIRFMPETELQQYKRDIEGYDDNKGRPVKTK